MWTVLLVEDEHYVRESIREIIPWEELGFTVIGEADNGEDALQQLREKLPDLVLCDIVMPIMDGVEFLKQARKEGYDSRFVMLTVTNEFEYVKTALEYGASNYILKLSLCDETIREMLVKIDLELKQKQKQRQLEVQQYYAGLWHRAMTGEWKDPPGEHLPLNIRECQPCTIISLLHGDLSMDELSPWLQLVLRDVPSSKVHIFKAYGHTSLFCWDDRCQPDELRSIPCGASYSSPVMFEWLHEAWFHNIVALSAYWYDGKPGVFLDHNKTRPVVEHATFWEMEKELALLFEMRKKEICHERIHELFQLAGQKRLPMPNIKDLAVRFTTVFYRITNRPRPALDDLINTAHHTELMDLVLGHLNTTLAQWIADDRDYTDHSTVNRVIHHLKENYYKEISVKQLAHMIHIDENYLSKLFKKKTGTTIINFLHNLRVQHAKAYLEQTDLTVSEVCEKVGFVNDNYFNKIFKRYTNETPGSYKKSIGKPEMF